MSHGQLSTIKIAFDILEHLGDENLSTPTEIAEALDMPLSTVHGYLSTLESIGYLQSQNGRYQVSATTLEIGVNARKNDALYNVSKPIIENLAEDLKEQATIITREGTDAIVYYTLHENNDIYLDTYPGLSLPPHATAAGKTTLAFLPPDRREAAIEKITFEPLTRFTITDREEFEKELETVRNDKIADVHEEYKLGISALGAPVFSDDTLVGAVCVAAPEKRMSRQSFKREATRKVETASNTIEVNLRNY
ncbi:IclR family transcriptional regulator domain-containing protein [Halobellus sp. GM3]|uniref:IclR family transcriptional regulator domain-containing protein n=1 Tax=Halobellus sp. GM3 TaxID=3458410 RepID=UPI00403E26C9